MEPLVYLAAFCALFCRSEAVRVTTSYGEVEGNEVNLVNQPANRVWSFLGIRYAQAPVGEFRWQRPRPIQPWEGVLNATVHGNTCHGGLGPLHPDWDRNDEDCLRVNIHTPSSINPNDLKPVMIYFHGGAYTGGGNVMYTGHFMAARDVIVVVANYRLGALGFASTGDDVARGNWGLWDQWEAMNFVKNIIQSFGGDPDRVTLYGQSAGASSAGLHIIFPQSRNLFHRAIMISGSDLSPWAINGPDLPPENYTKQVAQRLNCPESPSQAMMDCLRTKNASEVHSTPIDIISGAISTGWAPVVDGPGGMLPEAPVDARNASNFKQDIEVMAGHLTGDGSMYLLPFVPEAIDGGWNRSMHYYYIKERMVAHVLARDTEGMREYVSRAMQYYFTDWPDDEDPDKNRQKLVEAVTDVAYGFAQDRVLKQHSQYNAAYEYLFGFLGNPHSILLPEWMGTVHGLADIPFWFGYPMVPDNPEVMEEAMLDLLDIFPWSDEDKEFSNYVLNLFANFARSGNPTDPPVPAPGGQGNVNWGRFSESDLNYIYFGNDVVENRKNRRQKNNAFWTEYLYWVVFERNITPPSGTPAIGTADWSQLNKFEQELTKYAVSQKKKLGK